MDIRPPAVAGTFYPDDARALDALVGRLLHEARAAGASAPVEAPKAIIAPHAGYAYSGPVAATAYALVAASRHAIARVVVAGPSHHVAFAGLAVPSATHFATPLGPVPVDRDAIEHALALPQVRRLDAAHAHEHSLEVQVPFLQKALDAPFTLVPLSIGDASPAEVGEVLECLWGGAETLIVVSSDLSHYHRPATARRLDAATAARIAARADHAIGPDDACGYAGVCGLLWVARRLGLHVRTLDLRNSGDTAGPRDAVVGYGAFATRP